ncbi:gamma-glutamylcyclotransferase [Comamonas sp. J-3]|uniref:gamma-glutamylcyclotransferase family protein n=1 Tax=Comamonas trifloxystrobinivorans TaxID=3350256 RepID=UPI0037290FE6
MTETPSPAPAPFSAPVWSACGARHVAVYGTLRAGGVNDICRLDPDIICLGQTTLRGSLYDLGWYPGLSLQGTQAVLAEVYPIDDALEQALDGIEGIWPRDMGEYAKRLLTLPVHLHGGTVQTMELLVYEALPATVQGRPGIAASDWLAWYQAQGRVHPDTAFALNSAQA